MSFTFLPATETTDFKFSIGTAKLGDVQRVVVGGPGTLPFVDLPHRTNPHIILWVKGVVRRTGGDGVPHDRTRGMIAEPHIPLGPMAYEAMTDDCLYVCGHALDKSTAGLWEHEGIIVADGAIYEAPEMQKHRQTILIADGPAEVAGSHLATYDAITITPGTKVLLKGGRDTLLLRCWREDG
jgi:hypothetical protein